MPCRQSWYASSANTSRLRGIASSEATGGRLPVPPAGKSNNTLTGLTCAVARRCRKECAQGEAAQEPENKRGKERGGGVRVTLELSRHPFDAVELASACHRAAIHDGGTQLQQALECVTTLATVLSMTQCDSSAVSLCNSRAACVGTGGGPTVYTHSRKKTSNSPRLNSGS